MTSFENVMIPTHGNWFQTNPLEHESDDRAGNKVSSVCVTNGKDMAPQLQIWSTFVTVFWFRKTEIQDRAGILVLMRVLCVTISKIYWKFWHSFFNYTFKSSSNFYPIGNNVEKNGAFSFFETSVNGNVTFAYIIRLWRFTLPA